MVCPCGSGASFDDCCARFHRGAAPETPEQLMRARYSAFATGNVDFLVETGPSADREGLASWCARARFVRLFIDAVEPEHVTFRARFIEGGKAFELRERSRFARVDGRWRYLDGDAQVSPLPLGRNDRCPCGSGEKWKRCHAT